MKKRKSRKVRKKKCVRVYLKYTQQDVVHRCVRPNVYEEHLPTKLVHGPIKPIKGSVRVHDSKKLCNADIIWIDQLRKVTSEDTDSFKRTQRINRIVEMKRLCSKAVMFQLLNRLRFYFPREFNFYPRTYLSGESEGYNAFPHAKTSPKGNRRRKTLNNLYIIKPSCGSMGEGIYLSYGIQEQEIRQLLNKRECVIQKYIPNPYLVDGCKIDLRLYVLVVRMNYPEDLQVYIFNDGLVRLCTEKYKRPTTKNVSDAFMHLTNYSLNKYSEKFEFNERETEGDKGHKRTILQCEEIRNVFYGDNSYPEFQRKLDDLIIKVLISIQGEVKVHNNTDNQRFQLLGYDILLDSNLNPHLLEVNQNPSLHTDHAIDELVKQKLINQTIQLITIYKKKRSFFTKDKETLIDELCPGFRKIEYDRDEYAKYNIFTSDGLIGIYNTYCSVRNKKMMTSIKFMRFYSDYFCPRYKDVINCDLFFAKMKRKTGKAQMDFDSFVLLLVELAQRLGSKEESEYEKIMRVLRIIGV